MVRVGRETIAITTDTVGTKVLLAAELHRWEGVGEDCVQVNVNDLAAVGARPCGFVDTILCSSPDAGVFRSIGRGIERGLRASGCALLGGETAVVPDIVEGLDLGGTAIGFFPPKRAPVTGERIRRGDVVIGIPSSGFHANGYTLIRKLLHECNTDLSRPRDGASMPLGEELLQPGRIYTSVSEAIAGLPEVHGFAHFSGGGVRNLTRLNPRSRFVLDGWPAPAGLFQWIQELGQIPPEEMFQTFNTGIGFAVIARPVQLSALLRRLARAGAPDARVVGHVEQGGGVELPHLGVRFEGYA
jgi:phosphoribosylformylglycinamidine cyclo-ligase